jgi:tetratricopeptide (TPR) repeat protein
MFKKIELPVLLTTSTVILPQLEKNIPSEKVWSEICIGNFIEKSTFLMFQKSRSFPPAAASAPQMRMSENKPCFRNKPTIKQILKAGKPYILDGRDPRVETALIFFRKAEKLDPYNLSLLYNRGLFCEGQQELDDAIRFYQRIIHLRESQNTVFVVNAYERCGLVFLRQREECEDEGDKVKLKQRAEDMFMRSLVTCRKAVAHMPALNSQRASLWESYAKLLSLLRPSEGEAKKLRKEGEIHEIVGKYLEAVEVYQKVMEMASEQPDRTGAIIGCLRNYCRFVF